MAKLLQVTLFLIVVIFGIIFLYNVYHLAKPEMEAINTDIPHFTPRQTPAPEMAVCEPEYIYLGQSCPDLPEAPICPELSDEFEVRYYELLNQVRSHLYTTCLQSEQGCEFIN